MDFLRRIPFYPWLISLYPVLSLYVMNIDQVERDVIVRPAILSLIIGTGLFLLFWLILRNVSKAGILSAGYLVLFFSYGQVYALARNSALEIARHRYLVPLWIFLAVIWTLFVIKKIRDATRLNLPLNAVFVALLIYQLVGVGTHEYRVWRAEETAFVPEAVQSSGATALTLDTLPDIYYLIFDTYTREDILSELFEYDNGAFIDTLEERGFYVARCSQSNYARTELSLGSTLNLDYLDETLAEVQPNGNDRSFFRPFIRQNEVRTYLEGLGYEVVAFDSGFSYTRIKDANLYLSPPLGTLEGEAGLNSFEVLFLESTAGILLTDTAQFLPKSLVPDVEYEERLHRARVLYTLEELERLPQREGPKFVFAHLLVPHRPFVFGPNGEEIDAENAPGLGAPIHDDQSLNDFIYGYRDQLTYVNSRIIQLIDRLVQDSETDPIIIIQGDHGIEKARSPAERMAIFNAYYFPGGSYESLYPEITPVNSFRTVFNEYFDGEYPLLDDVSYYSEWYALYDFSEVPNTCTIMDGEP